MTKDKCVYCGKSFPILRQSKRFKSEMFCKMCEFHEIDWLEGRNVKPSPLSDAYAVNKLKSGEWTLKKKKGN